MAIWIWIALGAAYLATWMLIPRVLLKRTVHPSAAVAWILTIIFVPFLGALLCAVADVTRWERRTPRKQEASEHIDGHLPEFPPEQVESRGRELRLAPLAHIAGELTGAKVTYGNRVDLIPDQQRSLDVLEEAIREAQHSVHVEFYIWRTDEAGTRLRDRLIERARQGVEVRFLYDGFGSMLLSRSFLKPLKRAGAVVSPFTPGLTLWHLLTLNLRNHRKLVVVDGRFGFTGGMNIGDEYVHRTSSYGKLRDTQL
ncbi:MAG: PLDc N-terminal domain-containing protein, partial [Planctomycetes bacterium]|nr:PLDc N-terminal domain-containing protein [Planctomycetota bacterium]